MKKLILFAICSLFLGSVMSAQQRGQKERMTPEQQATQAVRRLNEELKLTDKQQADLKIWFTASFKKRNENFERNKGDREFMRKNMAKEREATDVELKKVLTADQYKKYKVNEVKRQQERKNRRDGQRFERR